MTAGRDRFRSRGWSIRDIVSEATRQPEACPHVDNPKPPILLHGYPLLKLVEIAECWGRQARTNSGGQYRKNQPIAACGVFSCPSDLRKDAWNAMKMRFIDYLNRQYGDRLKTVIEHIDEAHPHLHFYLVPRDGEDFGSVHPGYAASRKVRRDSIRAEKDDYRFMGDYVPENEVPKLGFLAGAHFRAVMQDWQDDIHTHVCEPFGLLRISPTPKRRKTRAEAMLAKQFEAKVETLSSENEYLKSQLALMQQAQATERAALNAKLVQESAASVKSKSDAAVLQAERDAPERHIVVDRSSRTVEDLLAPASPNETAHSEPPTTRIDKEVDNQETDDTDDNSEKA
jgi:hypothetical protein